MSRKLNVLVWVTVLALSLVMVGCPKKQPPPPTPVEEAPPPPAPPQEVVEPAAPAPVDATPDPLDADLVEVNRYVMEQGLIGPVFYDFDKYDLKPEARERLAKNAEFMKAHPQFVFTVEGHCDERGTNEYNIALGDRRSNAAVGYVTSLGIDSSRMKTVSFGEERPFCTESGESCWWRNRRAHFVITGRSGG